MNKPTLSAECIVVLSTRKGDRFLVFTPDRYYWSTERSESWRFPYGEAAERTMRELSPRLRGWHIEPTSAEKEQT